VLVTLWFLATPHMAPVWVGGGLVTCGVWMLVEYVPDRYRHRRNRVRQLRWLDSHDTGETPAQSSRQGPRGAPNADTPRGTRAATL